MTYLVPITREHFSSRSYRPLQTRIDLLIKTWIEKENVTSTVPVGLLFKQDIIDELLPSQFSVQAQMESYNETTGLESHTNMIQMMMLITRCSQKVICKIFP